MRIKFEWIGFRISYTSTLVSDNFEDKISVAIPVILISLIVESVIDISERKALIIESCLNIIVLFCIIKEVDINWNNDLTPFVVISV